MLIFHYQNGCLTEDCVVEREKHEKGYSIYYVPPERIKMYGSMDFINQNYEKIGKFEYESLFGTYEVYQKKQNSDKLAVNFVVICRRDAFEPEIVTIHSLFFLNNFLTQCFTESKKCGIWSSQGAICN